MVSLSAAASANFARPPMKTVSVIRSFRVAQEKRVAVYAEFDRRLRGMIQSLSFSQYPAACSAATSSFSEISADARAAIAVLGEAGVEAAAAARHAQQVQTLEAEKLTLTAALHLDMIRRQKLLPTEENSEEEADGEEDDDFEAAAQRQDIALIDQSLAQLQDKLKAIVESINENLEGLASEMAELADSE